MGGEVVREKQVLIAVTVNRIIIHLDEIIAAVNVATVAATFLSLSLSFVRFLSLFRSLLPSFPYKYLTHAPPTLQVS